MVKSFMEFVQAKNAIYMEESIQFAGKNPDEFHSPKGGKPKYMFKTGQGSEYLVTDDGMLLRNKSFHANTGGEDVGIQKWKGKVEFYDLSKAVISTETHKLSFPDALSNLMDDKGWTIALSKGNKGERIALVADKGSWRPAIISDAMPNAVKARPEWTNVVIKADANSWSVEPKIGWQPFDYNERANGTLSSVHNGSPITEVYDLSNSNSLNQPKQEEPISVKQILQKMNINPDTDAEVIPYPNAQPPRIGVRNRKKGTSGFGKMIYFDTTKKDYNQFTKELQQSFA